MMMGLKRSEDAGPGKVGLSSPIIEGRSEGATGGVPTRARAENAGVAPDEPQRASGRRRVRKKLHRRAPTVGTVQITEKRLQNVPATVRRGAVRTPYPN
jgi:hypothetical protein